MAFSRFVSDVAYENAFVGEAGGQLLSTGDHAAAIVAQVDDQSTAGSEVEEDVVEIAAADAVLKGGAAQVSGLVVENTVFYAAGDAVVGAEIAADERVAVVAGVVSWKPQ